MHSTSAVGSSGPTAASEIQQNTTVVISEEATSTNRPERMDHTDGEQELVARAQQGDRKAFRKLVDAFQQDVALTVVSMLGPSAEVDDVVQDTFIKCYQTLDRFRGDARFLTYVKKIAVHRSLDVLRRRKRFRGRFLSRDDEERRFDEPSSEGDADLDAMERAKLVHQAIDRLSPEHRAVVVLRLIEGYSTEETADMLNLAYGTVLSRLSRALKKLKELLTPYLSS